MHKSGILFQIIVIHTSADLSFKVRIAPLGGLEECNKALRSATEYARLKLNKRHPNAIYHTCYLEGI